MSDESIFAEALAISGTAAREEYLERACAGNSRLRREVDALLAAHAGENPLDRPFQVDGETLINSSSSAVGTIIAGRYKLLEQIGDGGMGTVWMAEQREPVKRLVAVKLIKAGMDSKAVLARFEAERQALAMMDHPNIAKVHDAGTSDDGRPYFVMELVKGLPLTEYCDSRRLSVQDRLELFVQICSAVQHAHQKAIIHRDLKPTNILVTEHDGKPVPKVIDFGLAKALGTTSVLTDRTLHTAYGTVVGTPLYMAPEQVGINALDVDTRTDIYALGVILYELLTGSTPLEKAKFKEAAWEEVKRLIREEEPQRPSLRLSSDKTLASLAASRQMDPSQLPRMIRGDLDWIVMKSLDKDRGRRYETANGLARDVERYLSGDVVEACPPTLGYRLRKYIHRNRGKIIGAGLLLATLLLGIFGTTFGLIRAQAAAEREVKLRLIAENAIDQMLTLLESQTSDEASDSLISQSVITDQQKQLLEIAVKYFRELSEQPGTDEATRSRVAAAAFRLAKLEYHIGDDPAGSNALNVALNGYNRLKNDFPDEPEYRYQLALCYCWRAGVNIEFDSGKVLEDLKPAYGLAAELTEADSGNPDYQQLLANIHTGQGIAFLTSGQESEADEEMFAAVVIMEKVAAKHKEPKYQYALACALNSQSLTFGRTNRKSEGAEASMKSRKIIEKLANDTKGLSDRDRWQYRQAYAVSLHNKARYYQVAGQLQLALETYSDGQAYCEQLRQDYRGLAFPRVLLGRIRVGQGITLRALGNLEEAQSEVDEAQQILEKLLNEHDADPDFVWEVAFADGYLGTLLRDQLDPDLDGSLTQLTKAIGMAHGLKHQEYTRMQGFGTLPHYLGERAITNDRKGDYDSALADWRDAIKRCQHDQQLDDVPAYKLGQLATLIQQGTKTADEAVAETKTENLFDSPEEKCPNRLYHIVRFYAIAAQHCPDATIREEYIVKAIGYLETLIDRIGPCYVDLNPGNVDFDVLRDNPRFKALEAEIAAKAQDMNEDLTTK